MARTSQGGTGGKGVDLIVDMVSGGVASQNLEAAALLGRIVDVGRLGGMTGEFNFDLHALKRIDTSVSAHPFILKTVPPFLKDVHFLVGALREKIRNWVTVRSLRSVPIRGDT